MVKRYEELTISDDFMFGKTMGDKVLCRDVLEQLLEEKVGELEDVQPQREFRYTSGGKQPWIGYDIIEGGVADDRVIDAVEAYINGYADVEHTLRQLVYHKPNYQICILSQEIVDKYLQFKSYERI